MKLLSLYEPWSTLMAVGAKRIETRSWSTNYRGWLAIQSSKAGLSRRDLMGICGTAPFSEALNRWYRWEQQMKHDVRPKGWIKRVFPHGCIVAVVRLQACCPTHQIERAFPGRLTPQERAFGDYTDGRYGWLTDSLYQLPAPIPFRARQGLCNVDEATVQQIMLQGWRP